MMIPADREASRSGQSSVPCQVDPSSTDTPRLTVQDDLLTVSDASGTLVSGQHRSGAAPFLAGSGSDASMLDPQPFHMNSAIRNGTGVMRGSPSAKLWESGRTSAGRRG